MAALIVPSRSLAHAKMVHFERWLWLGGVRFYNVRPLRRNLGGVYLPDPANPRTPARHLEAAFEAKLFGRYGAASKVDPARLWPAPEQLREMEAEERASCPLLREMEAALEAKEQAAAAQQRQR